MFICWVMRTSKYFIDRLKGYTEHLETGFEGTSTDPGVIALGFYSGMFAFDGWCVVIFGVETLK